MPWDRRRIAALSRSEFTEFQAKQFEASSRKSFREYQADTFARSASLDLERERARQQYERKARDPGVYQIPGVKGLWEGTGTLVGGALDYLGRPHQALAGGILSAIEGRSWWDGVGEGLRGEGQDLNYATIYERLGMENELARNVLGFATDMVMDPLNLFALGPVRAGTRAALGAASALTVKPIAAIPLKGKTLGRRADDVSGPVQRVFARMFSPRFSEGSGDTYWEARRNARRSGQQSEVDAVEEMVTADRRLRNYRRNRETLAMQEMYDAMHVERVEAALRPSRRFVVMPDGSRKLREFAPEARTRAEAERIADAHVENLSKNDEWAVAIGERMLRLRDEVKEATPHPETVTSEEAAQIVSRPVEGRLFSPEGRPLERIEDQYDLAEAQLETLGMDEFGQAGWGSLARVVQSKWGRIRDKNGKLSFRDGELAQQSEKYLGLITTEDWYIQHFYPDSELVQRIQQQSPSLREKVAAFTMRRKRTAEEALEAGVERDFRAIWVNDIASRRMAVEAAKIIDPATLGGAGGRMVRRLTPEQYVGVQTILRKGGVDIEAAGRRWVETTGDHEEALDLVVSEMGKGHGGPLRKLLEQLPRNDEGIYMRGGATKLMMDDSEIDAALAVMGEKAVKPQEEMWVLPETIATSLRKFNTPYEMNGFLRTVDAFNSVWKQTVTVFPAFVSFFTRNAIGLVQNLALSGMGPMDIASNQARAAAMMKGGLGRGHTELTIKLNAEGQRRWAQRGAAMPGSPGVDGRSYSLRQEELVRQAQMDGGMHVGAAYQAPVSGSTQPGRAAALEQVTATSRADVPGAQLGELPGPAAGVGAYREADRPFAQGVRRFFSAIRGEDAIRMSPMERTKASLAAYGEGMMRRHRFNPFGYGATANQAMDNSARIAHILWRLEHGDTITEASRSAAKFIGDYTELGSGTREIAAFIPFFRWTRFNIPIQVEGLVTRPYVGSKLAAIRGDEGEQQQMMAEGTSLPDWVLDRHHVLMGRTSEGKLQILRGLGLPIEDLNKIFVRTGVETAENWLSELTPILRAPIELVTNRSFWTGEAIDDDDDLYGFYKRGYAWATMPGISETLNQWLEITQEVNPDTGRISYTSGNPIAMFTLGSFFGRFAQTGDKLWRAVESRDEEFGGQMVNLLTGAKVSEVYPERPPVTTTNQALNRSPYLRSLWDEYQGMPLYPQFDNAEDSRRAVRAITEINAFRRLMQSSLDRKVTWSEAAARWGDVGHENIRGEVLARQVKDGRWKQKGSKARKSFMRAHPTLYAAITDNLSDIERLTALDSDAAPS